MIYIYSYENKLNRDNLVQYLLDYAFDNGYGFILCRVGLDDPSASYPDKRLMVINTNLSDPNELPFIIAHEIGHLMLKHERTDFDQSAFSGIKTDAQADAFAIRLIANYCLENDCYFDSWLKFAEIFCIPKRVYYLFDRITTLRYLGAYYE